MLLNVVFIAITDDVHVLHCSNHDERVEWIRRIDKEIQACAEKNNFTPVATPERSYDVSWTTHTATVTTPWWQF